MLLVEPRPPRPQGARHPSAVQVCGCRPTSRVPLPVSRTPRPGRSCKSFVFKANLTAVLDWPCQIRTYVNGPAVLVSPLATTAMTHRLFQSPYATRQMTHSANSLRLRSCNSLIDKANDTSVKHPVCHSPHGIRSYVNGLKTLLRFKLGCPPRRSTIHAPRFTIRSRPASRLSGNRRAATASNALSLGSPSVPALGSRRGTRSLVECSCVGASPCRADT